MSTIVSRPSLLDQWDHCLIPDLMRAEDIYFQQPKTTVYLVIDFEASEDRIVETNIDTNRVESNRVGLVCFQWRGNGQTCLRVTIENVDELLFFDRA